MRKVYSRVRHCAPLWLLQEHTLPLVEVQGEDCELHAVLDPRGRTSVKDRFLPPMQRDLVGWGELVPERGLEPPRPCDHCDLNAARLPVPPLGHECEKASSSVAGAACNEARSFCPAGLPLSTRCRGSLSRSYAQTTRSPFCHQPAANTRRRRFDWPITCFTLLVLHPERAALSNQVRSSLTQGLLSVFMILTTRILDLECYTPGWKPLQTPCRLRPATRIGPNGRSLWNHNSFQGRCSIC